MEQHTAEALAERFSGATLGAHELLTIYLGDRLGLYQALADLGQATPWEVAEATGTHERYAREWLEQQAVGGILAVEDSGAEAGERRYRIPAGHEEALLDPDSLSYLVPMARSAMSLASALPAVEKAFRTGGGVAWAEYGREGLEAQEGANRPVFVHLLGSEWLPSVADVHQRLQVDPPAAVADVACGAGWSSIAIARTYPKVRVDGYDVDEASIELARKNAAEAGLDERVRFHHHDASGKELPGRYDLVTVFEALHDMSRPVEVLRTLRALAGEEGTVLVVDEKVADEFTVPGDEVERLMYTYSVLCCLPVGMAEHPSAATGTVMRTETLRRYATEAGFSRVDVLPIEHDVFRFYRLS